VSCLKVAEDLKIILGKFTSNSYLSAVIDTCRHVSLECYETKIAINEMFCKARRYDPFTVWLGNLLTVEEK
jgi:hypothetical protein